MKKMNYKDKKTFITQNSDFFVFCNMRNESNISRKKHYLKF